MSWVLFQRFLAFIYGLGGVVCVVKGGVDSDNVLITLGIALLAYSNALRARLTELR